MDKQYTQSILKKRSLIALIQIGFHGEVVQFSKLFHFIQIIMIQVAQANFRDSLLNQKNSVMLGGVSICPRKRDSSTYMIIHIKC